jgi:hypothetical protein
MSLLGVKGATSPYLSFRLLSISGPTEYSSMVQWPSTSSPAHPYVCDGGDVSLSTVATNADTQPVSATVLAAVAGPIPPLDSGLSNRLPKQVYRPRRSANDTLRLREPSATTPPLSSGRVGHINGPGELVTNDTLGRVVGQGKGSLVDEMAFQHALDPPSTIVAQSSKHERCMDKALGTSYEEHSEGVQMEDEDSQDDEAAF